MLRRALELFEELSNKEGMALAYGNLSVIHEQKGDKARTCECWRKERDLWHEMGLMDKAAEIEQWMKSGCP